MCDCGWSGGNVVALITAIGTAVLAIYAIIQSRQAGRQISAAEKQADTAAASAQSADVSAGAAVAAQGESVRLRVDQSAPRVVAFFERPDGPYMRTKPQGGLLHKASGLLDSESIEQSTKEAGRELAFPDNANDLIWYRGIGVVVNEGTSSAAVRIDTESRFVEGKNPLDGRDLKLPYMAGDEISPEAILPPSGAALFEWAQGHTAREWANAVSHPEPPNPYGSVWITITVFDAQRSAVIDTLEAIFIPTPLSASPGREGLWKVEDEDQANRVHVQPVTRGYVFEGASTENRRHQRELYRDFTELDRNSW